MGRSAPSPPRAGPATTSPTAWRCRADPAPGGGAEGPDGSALPGRGAEAARGAEAVAWGVRGAGPLDGGAGPPGPRPAAAVAQGVAAIGGGGVSGGVRGGVAELLQGALDG